MNAGQYGWTLRNRGGYAPRLLLEPRDLERLLRPGQRVENELGPARAAWSRVAPVEFLAVTEVESCSRGVLVVAVTGSLPYHGLRQRRHEFESRLRGAVGGLREVRLVLRPGPRSGGPGSGFGLMRPREL